MQNAKANYSKPFVRSLRTFLLVAMFTFGGITAYILWQSSQTRAESNSTSSVPEIKRVTALGRLEPSGKVIRISAPSPSSFQGERVKELLVKEGELVTKNQTIAILDSHARASAALKQAVERVKVTQANLAQVKAGAKTGEIEAQKAAIARIEAERSNEIEAQKATVARLEAELENAEIEYQRNKKLYADGAVSASERDSKQLTFKTAQRQIEEAKANLTRISTATKEQIQEAKATLDRISEVRTVDINVATAEVREAQAAVARAQVDVDLAYIKAPQDGQILDILNRPGEAVSSDGIARMGQTSQMYAVAEVYESDIGKIQLGQQVKVTSNTVSGELHGTVKQIGLEVKRQEVINTDPAANIDAKIVEVKVLLDKESSRKVAELTNLLVKVAIIL